MKNRFLATTALAGLAFLTATPAFALCDNNTPASGQTVTCTNAGGGSNVRIDRAASTNVTINVNSTGIVTNGDAVTLGNGANITVSGSGQITGNPGNGVVLHGGGTITLNDTAYMAGHGNNAILYAGGGGDNIAVNINTSATLDGTSSLGDASVTLTMTGGGLGGVFDAGAGGTDALVLTGTGNQNFDTDRISNFDTHTKDGTGTWTLAGTNAQDWSVSDGTLAAAYNNAGNISGAGGTFRILNSSGVAQNFTGNITGGVSVLKSGGNDLTLTGTNGFTGSLTVNNSTTLTLEDMAAASAASGVNIDQSTLVFGAGFDGTTYDRNFVIGDNDATLSIGNNVDVTLSGVVSNAGDGRWVKGGQGQITLSNTSNSFNNGFIINDGAVSATHADALGSGTININNGTILQVTGGGTLENDMTGVNGRFQKNGGAALTLTGNNDFTGQTSIANNTTLIVEDAAALSATINIQINDSTFQFGNGFNNTTYDREFTLMNEVTFDTQANNVTLSGDIDDGIGGNLAKTGTGSLTLSGTNTYSGLTNINAGTLSVAASNNLGNAGGGNNLSLDGGTLAITGSFANNRTVALGAAGGGMEIAAGQTLTQNGTRSGAGALTKTGAGTLILNNAGTNSGVVNINAGIVSIGASNRLGDGSGTNDLVFNGGTLQIASTFNEARDITLDAGGGTIDSNGFGINLQGLISGTGDLAVSGIGGVTLSGNNTFSGKVIADTATVFAISDASLGDNSGTNTITLRNAGTLRYQSAFTNARDVTIDAGGGAVDTNGQVVTMSGDLSGTGAFTKTGGGTLTLGGTNAYTGGSILLAGDVIGTTGSIVGDWDVQTAGTNLNFTQNTNGTYAGDLTGAGNLVKAGTGTVTLTGNSGGFGGFTNIFTGGLVVNGDLNNSWVNVGAGGTLGGSGRIQVFDNSGIVAPGNSIGTLNVDDFVRFQVGSFYDVEINDAGQSDLVIATGAVDIFGGTVRVSNFGGTQNYAASTTYTILQGSAVNGTFDAVTTNLAFLDPTLIYNAANVQLRMDRNDTDFSQVAHDERQAKVGTAITDLGTGNDIFDAFIGLTETQAREAMDDLSGEHNAGVSGALAQSSGIIQSALTSHMTGLAHIGGSGDIAALAPAKDPSLYVAAYFEPGPVSQNIQFWFEALGTIGQSNARLATPGQDRHSYGALAGLDIPLEDGGWYGFFGGYETGEIETDSQSSSSELGNYHAGAFMTRPLGKGFNISGGFGGTYHAIDSTRYVVFPGVNEAITGDTSGYTLSGFTQISKPLQMDGIALEPFAGLSVTYSHTDGYTESGGASALAIDSTSTTNPATVIGARFGKSVSVNDATLNLNASLGWQHTFGDVDGGTSMRFAAGTTSFNSYGPPRARDSALVGLGGDARIAAGAKAYAGYNGALSADSQDHGFKAGLKLDF